MSCKYEGCDNPSQKELGSTSGSLACATCYSSVLNYGITTPEREAILLEQGSTCKICQNLIVFTRKKSSGAGKNSAVVDHCHTTGKVRGILCGSCNIMLGKSYDSPQILRAAADYLEGED